jgi:hypothetical protein
MREGIFVFHRGGLSLRGMESETTHTPFSLPIPNVLCQTFPMRNLTATICLTLAVLLGTFGPAKSRPLTGVDVSRWVILHTWVDVRDSENVKINLNQFDEKYPASFKSKEGCHNAITKWYLRDGMKIRKDQYTLRLVKGGYPGIVEQVSCIRIQLDELPFKRQ